MKFTFKGVTAMQRKLERIKADMIDRVGPALRTEAELIMTDSKRNYVPVDEGKLRSSGTVGKVERSVNVLTVKLSFGGIAAPYALSIHEHLSEHSPPSWKKAKVVRFNPSGHGPKYLERPLMKAVRGMSQRIASRLQVGQ